MTYIACVLNKNGVVLSADSRANYFDDYIESGRVKGKSIKFYWDGNRKLFLIKNKFAIGAQGLLCWGKSRLLLHKIIKNFEEDLLNKESNKSVAEKIHKYFRQSKRDTTSISEVMHFLVCGIENNLPIGFYVNTHYDKNQGVQQLPLDTNKTLYVNGDGKAEFINGILSIKEGINFCKSEVVKKHREAPYDVGGKVDILAISSKEPPYWAERTDEIVSYNTYDDLMQAIQCQKLRVGILDKPQILFYKQ